ncbi:Hypothetical predicted protein [Podarcis lilfordi]|uniref:Uncharacterized protein n=1 Tax=Podarcis lilfordi TaxID=74358 RepID=A0AA35KV29_9SAUR|nr:Hypothetical predicted protein [Podarcis lilfordi]
MVCTLSNHRALWLDFWKVVLPAALYLKAFEVILPTFGSPASVAVVRSLEQRSTCNLQL